MDSLMMGPHAAVGGGYGDGDCDHNKYGSLMVAGHLLQQTLRCLCSDSSSGDWVYSVFWRILPRNYPPPKWDSENNAFDRSKGNKRNWILVWEDGFCDFVACAKKASSSSSSSSSSTAAMNGHRHHEEYMQPELFFKMSHEVYNFGEGLMGKVAADSSHKWVYRDPPDSDPHYSSSWQGALDPHPRTWEAQFKSGIETIAIVAVKEGLVQLGSLKKAAAEDLNFVLFLQRKFNYLHSIPGVYAIHPSALNMLQQQQQTQSTIPKASLTCNMYVEDMRTQSTTIIGSGGMINTKTLINDYDHDTTLTPIYNVIATRDFFENVDPLQYSPPTHPHFRSMTMVPNGISDDNDDDDDFINNINSAVYMAEEVLDDYGGHRFGNIEYRHATTAYNSLHALLSRLPSVMTSTTTSPDSTTSSSATFEGQYVPYFPHTFVQHTHL